MPQSPLLPYGALVPNLLLRTFHGLANRDGFLESLRSLIRNLGMPRHGVHASDNLITFGRNLGFMEDAALMAAYAEHATTPVERSILWRIATVVWAARHGMKLDGDFVECACYRGTTARIVYDCVGLGADPGRHYFLYDLFGHDPANPTHAIPDGGDMREWVAGRFAGMPNVTVTKGRVPDVLHDVAPDRIAFMNLDLNDAEAEIGALEILFDRMVPGAILLLDDYGWRAYRSQKLAEDPWLQKRGYQVLELPTGQGLVVIR